MKETKIEKKCSSVSFVAKVSVLVLAAWLGMVGIPQLANAAIVHTDLAPDFVGITVYLEGPDSTYDLDLNNDSLTDFQINNTGEAVSISSFDSPYNGILADGDTARILNSGDSINASRTNWVDYADLIEAEGYIGLKLAVSEYFGWVQLSVTKDSVGDDHIVSFTVFDYAYETEDGVAILAGDTTGSSVPIPGAIWLFGSGLIGLVGFRRKFRKA